MSVGLNRRLIKKQGVAGPKVDSPLVITRGDQLFRVHTVECDDLAGRSYVISRRKGSFIFLQGTRF